VSYRLYRIYIIYDLILQGDSMLHLAVSRSNSLKTQNIFEEGGSQMVEYPQYPSLSFLGGIFVSSSFLIGI
jgi:hypothetical protein